MLAERPPDYSALGPGLYLSLKKSKPWAIRDLLDFTAKQMLLDQLLKFDKIPTVERLKRQTDRSLRGDPN